MLQNPVLVLSANISLVIYTVLLIRNKVVIWIGYINKEGVLNLLKYFSLFLLFQQLRYILVIFYHLIAPYDPDLASNDFSNAGFKGLTLLLSIGYSFIFPFIITYQSIIGLVSPIIIGLTICAYLLFAKLFYKPR